MSININHIKSKNKLNRLSKMMREFMLLLGVLASLTCLYSCSDKDLSVQDDNPLNKFNDEDLFISFSMVLNEIQGTRDSEGDEVQVNNIDNYIDTTKMQILFVDKTGDFLFQPPVRFIKESPDKNGQWDVYIPLTKEVFQKESASVNLIKAALEKDNFRIAILANWPETVAWGWEQSALKSKESPANINDLHHLKYDETYATKSGGAYNFIMKEGKMGINTDWKQYRDIDGTEFNSNDKAWHLDVPHDDEISIRKNAYAWIKNNWDPTVDAQTNDESITKHGIYRHYAKLWQVWNFGGGFDNPTITYDRLKQTSDEDLKSSSDKYTKNWKEDRNGNLFQDNWLKEDGKVISYTTVSTPPSNEYTIDGLTVVSKGASETGNNFSSYVTSYIKSGKYGLLLPQMNSLAIDNSKIGEEKIKLTSESAFEYLKFSVPGTGKLRVLFSSLTEGTPVTLVIQRGSTWEAKYSTSSSDIQEITNTKGTVKEFGTVNSGYKVSITGDSEDLIIYCLEGSAVIYAIEYVCSDYLDATDREGIMPSKSNPIPMYGIQEFNKIESWGSQNILDISRSGDQVKLIRSLAKVELYLPKGGNTVSHVYLRSMNQKARCEPMDVLTSTGDLWGTSHSEGNCEWFRIQKHGTKYKGGDDTTTWQDWFGWFYGSWKTWWPEFKGKTFSDSNNDPPGLFNPDIQRTDFCHFLLDTEFDKSQDQYHRFILYVPDKNISDPGEPGKLSKTTKVSHIEYRYSGNSNFLDDNDCYRIYFTDYENNPYIKTTKFDEFESDYEKSEEKLNWLWPIMRNHVYRFYVGSSNTLQEIRVKVDDWGEGEIKNVTW